MRLCPDETNYSAIAKGANVTRHTVAKVTRHTVAKWYEMMRGMLGRAA